MQTKDPALTKTLITDPVHTHHEQDTHGVHHDVLGDDHKGTETFQETVIGTRYPSDDINHTEDDVISHNINYDDHTHDNHTHKGAETFRESVVGSDYIEEHAVNHHDSSHNDRHNHDIENHATMNKEADIFQETVVDSEHVYDGDDLARQPDRRDQQGNPFDDGINEHTLKAEQPKSEGINDVNRYASIDNAQSRILNPDEK